MSATRGPSQRLRQPSRRFKDYEGDDFPSLSQSVGRPPSAATPSGPTVVHSTQQTRKDKARPANHDDIAQPNKLPPTKRRKGEVDNECILDKTYESLTTDEHRLEWLFQAIEQLGDTTDFRGDPDCQDVDILHDIFLEICGDPQANDNDIPQTPAAIHVGPGVSIRSGAQKALGVDHRGATKLVQINDSPRNAPAPGLKISTAGAAAPRAPVAHAPVPRAPAPHASVPRSQPKNVAATSTAPSKPPAQAIVAQHTTKVSGPTNATTSQLKSTPSKSSRPGKISRARVEELQRESVNKPHTNAATVGSPSSKPTPQANQSVMDLTHSDEVEPLDQTGLVPDNSATTIGDDNEERADQTPTDTKQPTKRKQSQLAAFPREYSEIVDWVATRIKLKLALENGYPEVTPVTTNQPGAGDATTQSSRMVLDDWVVDFWAAAHAELHPEQPRLPIEGCRIRYIRKSIAPSRNHDIRTACDGLVTAHFGLHQSSPDHIQKAKDLLLDEAWLSPNLANDDF
ncbi:hypothetical protein FRC12_013360 [Ceratobasidium sp. 428]|nr:hypothetical protein FRC12_013360 [Ceratobasidium sp. 428]